MILSLQRRIDDGGPVFRWLLLTSGAKLVWFLLILVFSAGSALAYYSSNIVMRDEFEPVKQAVARLSGVSERLSNIEGFLAHQSKCAIYQSTYIRDLADYAAGVRIKPPVMPPVYHLCLSKTPSLEH